MFVVLVAKALDVGTCPMLLWTRLMSSVYVCSPGSKDLGCWDVSYVTVDKTNEQRICL